MEEVWNKYLNSRIKIIYEDDTNSDGTAHYSPKVGILVDITDTHFILENESKRFAILISNILRVEGLEVNEKVGDKDVKSNY